MQKSSRASFRCQLHFFIERGITTFEEEFPAHIVLSNGKGTVGDWLLPHIDKPLTAPRSPRELRIKDSQRGGSENGRQKMPRRC